MRAGPPAAPTARRLVACGLLACAVAACGAPGPAGGAAAPTGDGLDGELTVLAAASLTDTFTVLGEQLEAAHPGLDVTFSFAGSSALAAQVTQGAPADVLATASPATMQLVVDAGEAAGPPSVFARNTLQVAVPPDDPGDVDGLEDLADPARTVALCAVEVPCGAATERLFAAAGLTPAPDTLEQDVRAALTKVELGEVDAAVVYRTDVQAADGAVVGVDVPQADRAATDYLVTVLQGADLPAAARAFVDLVLSPTGQQVLADAGFDRP